MHRLVLCVAVAALSVIVPGCGRTAIVSLDDVPPKMQPEAGPEPSAEAERCGFVAAALDGTASVDTLVAADGSDLVILSDGGRRRHVHRVNEDATWATRTRIEEVQARGEWVLVRSVAFGEARYEFELSLLDSQGGVAWTRHAVDYAPVVHLSDDGVVALHASHEGTVIWPDGSFVSLGGHLPISRANADGWVPVERRPSDRSEGFWWVNPRTGASQPFAGTPRALDAWSWEVPRMGDRVVYLADEAGSTRLIAERPHDAVRITLGASSNSPASEVLAANHRGFALAGPRWSSEGVHVRIDLNRGELAPVTPAAPDGWAWNADTFRFHDVSLLEDGSVAAAFFREGQSAVFATGHPEQPWTQVSAAIELPEVLEWFGREAWVHSRGGSTAIATVDQLGYLSQITALQVARGGTTHTLRSPPPFDVISQPSPIELSPDGLCAAAWTREASELRLVVLDVATGETAIAWGRPLSPDDRFYRPAPVVTAWRDPRD